MLLIHMKKEGFTLIEVMVSVAMAAMLSIGVVKISGLGHKIKKTSIIKSEISSRMNLLKTYFASPNTCLENISKTSIDVRDMQKVYKYSLKNGVSIVFNSGVVLDPTAIKSHNGIVFSELKLRLSRKDILKYGAQHLEETSLNIANYAEFAFKFDVVAPKNSISSTKREIVKVIPVYITFSGGMITACSSVLDDVGLKSLEKVAVLDNCLGNYAVDIVGDEIKCVPKISDGEELQFLTCIDGEYLKSTKVIDDNGIVKFVKSCATPFCKNGEIGIWLDGKVECINCNDNEFVTINSSGELSCSRTDCSKSSGDIFYLSGFSPTGEGLCSKLVEDNSDLKCGENGYKLVTTSSTGSITAKCCSDCPNRSNICEGTSIVTTSDCEKPCVGKKKRQAMSYTAWGSCETDSTKIKNTGWVPYVGANSSNLAGWATYTREENICTKKRRAYCNNIDSNGYSCCRPESETSIVRKPCFNGNWMRKECSIVSYNGSYSFVSESVCEKGKCCNYDEKPADLFCPSELYLGSHTFQDCLDAGGSIKSFSREWKGSPRSFYCNIFGACPVGWFLINRDFFFNNSCI